MIPHPKSSKRSSRGIPGRQDGRSETLGMAVGVADRRAEVVRGDDPLALAVDAAHDHDAAQERQFVLGQAHRGRPSASRTSSSESPGIVVARP